MNSQLDKFNIINNTLDIEPLEPKHLVVVNSTSDVNIYHDETSDELLSLDTLKSDLKNAREILLSNTQKGKLIIDQITQTIIEDNYGDPKLVDAVANLIKHTNSSLKDLSSMYKDLQDLEDRKKSRKPTENPQSIQNTQNNIFVGNAKDILEMLSNNR